MSYIIFEHNILEQPHIIKYIDNQTENIALKVVSLNGLLLEHIKKECRTKNVIDVAINNNSSAIQFVNNPDDDLCMRVILSNPYNIQYIDNPTYEMKKIAVDACGFCICYIENPDYDLCKLAVTNCPTSIRYIKNPDQELCKIAVSTTSQSIASIKNPTYELCKMAVEESFFNISSIKNPNYELYKIACDKAKKHVVNMLNTPSFELCVKILEEEPHLIKDFIKLNIKFTEKLYEHCINIDHTTIWDMIVPPKYICETAINKNYKYLKHLTLYIKTPNSNTWDICRNSWIYR